MGFQKKNAVAAAVVLWLCVACGGGGSGTATPGAGTPLAVVTSPAELQSRDAIDLRWTFSGALAASSAAPANFVLSDADGNVIPVTATLDGESSVRIAPREPLALGATYTLRMSGNVQSATGSPLGAEVVRSFTVADGQWRAAPASLLLAATDPVFGADAAGNLFVARQAHDGARFTVQVDRLDAATGQWSSTQVDTPDPVTSLLSAVPGGSTSTAGSIAPQLAVSASGWVAVAWRTSPDTGVKARVFDPRTGTWGAVTNVGPADPGNRNPAVAVDGAGNVTVVLPVYGGVAHDVLATRLAPGSTSWSTPAPIASGLQAFSSTRVAVDPDATVTTLLYFSAGSSLPMVHRAARLDPSTGQWSPLRRLEATETVQTFQRFTHTPGHTRQIVFRNAEAGASVFGFDASAQQWVVRSTWSESPADRGMGEWVADAKGRAVRAELFFDPVLAASEWRARYSVDMPAGTTWSAPLVLRSAPGQVAANVKLAGDEWGNAVAVWTENGAFTMKVWAQRFVRSKAAWEAPVALGEGTNSGALTVTTLPGGRYLASWAGGAQPLLFR